VTDLNSVIGVNVELLHFRIDVTKYKISIRQQFVIVGGILAFETIAVSHPRRSRQKLPKLGVSDA
jgi:hypothetical protein